MIDKKVLAYSRKMLQAWLSFDAGCSLPEYFGAHKGTLGLELQQVPEEYSQLLCWFREQKFEDYLELGVGRGGSFLLNVAFQSRLKHAVCVDNSEYWKDDQKKSIEEKVKWLKENTNTSVTFYDQSTDDYFADYIQGPKYDCIFIDADHSYEGVKKDFNNALRDIRNGGYIIFHDINSSSCPGVMKIWEEVGVLANSLNDLSQCVTDVKTFIHGNNCGIGIIQIKDND